MSLEYISYEDFKSRNIPLERIEEFDCGNSNFNMFLRFSLTDWQEKLAGVTYEVMPDHIHIFVDVPQTVAPCDVARTLKSISAIELFKTYPQLKQFYARCGVLWSRGYFISTVGHISEATVIKYIEEQKNK